MSCSRFSSQWWKGFGIGFSNIIGLGGAFNPTDDKTLTSIQQQLSDQQAIWSQKLAEKQSQLTQDQITMVQTLIQKSDATQASVNETVSEKVETDHAVIIMLVILMVFVIIYLLTEPEKISS
jgi:predicted PurR-regulated permease PerM